MSTIINAVGSSSTNWLARQFINAASRQAQSKDQTLPAQVSSVSSKPDVLNSQVTALMKKWSDAKQAIDKLGNANQEINQSRKAFAAEVLKRIKEQIRIVMMLTAGDPKARARQIASLARELAAAAQEYAAASGSSSQSSEASTTGSASVQNETASTGEQSNSASAAANATGAGASTASQSDQNIRSTAPDAPPTTTTSPTEPAQYQPTSTHQVYEQLANKISAYNQTTPASKEDQEFAMEVRKLAAQLKALSKQNEVHTHKRPDQSTERETADTNEALREVEHSVAIIDSPSVSNTPSINIVVG